MREGSRRVGTDHVCLEMRREAEVNGRSVGGLRVDGAFGGVAAMEGITRRRKR